MQIVEWGKPLERRDYANPQPEGTQVLVKVEACGVCHSDLHIHDGYFDFGNGRKLELAKLGLTLPHTLGHEIVGEVPPDERAQQPAIDRQPRSSICAKKNFVRR